MRLKQYLNEAAIQPKTKEVNIFRKSITDVWKTFRTTNKYPSTRSGVGRAMKAAATQISKKIKDLKVVFKVTKSWNQKGGAFADEPKHELFIEYNTEDAYDDWMGSDYNFKNWLDSFMTLVKHELVHIEQYRRIKKNSGDIQKVRDILFDTQEKAERKYHDNMEQYLSTHIETMAHAKQAVDQLLKGYKKEDLIRIVKNSKDIEELSFESSAFSSYYDYMRAEYPKVWRKFLKYFIEYVKKEK
jgi:hypothetical protein